MKILRPAAVATSAGLGLLLAGAIATPAHAAALPFTDAQKAYAYPSNATYDYIPIMDSFSDLVANRPDVIASNDAQTIAINNAASEERRQRAIVDQYADMSVSMADGLGARLGAIYEAALAADELPKTEFLTTKSGGLIGYYSSTNPAKDHFDYDRPYLRIDQSQLVYRDRPGGDAWASTSGAFPSGHTSQAYWQGTALATMLPELAPQILARTSEAGDNRIVMGAHYALDVIGGRMMGQHIVERRWSDPEFRVLLEEAAVELRTVLEAGCGDALADCIAADTPYLPTEDALAVYRDRLDYDFAPIGATDEALTLPADAESLLISSHPALTPEQRRQVLTLTAIGPGAPLDQGARGSWQRIDLAAAMAADVVVNADGSVRLAGAPAPVDPAPVDPVPVDPAPVDPAPVAPAPVDPTAPGSGGGSDTGTAPAAGTGTDALERTSTSTARELSATGADAAQPATAWALGLLLAGLIAVVTGRRLARR